MSELPRSDEELALVELARRVLPAGSFGNLPPDIVIREGRGGRVWDISGNEYVDFLLGSGPMFIGHCHPDVMAAVQAQIPAGHDVLRQQRTRDPVGSHHCRCGSLRREGALRQQRNRGGRLRHARRPRVPRPRQDTEVRGRLSRHERLQPDEPGTEAARQFPAGGAGFARHPAQRARRDDHRAVQRRGDGGQSDPRTPRRIGRRHRRAVPAAAAAEAGFPSGTARCVHGTWRSADLRRGGHGVPLCLWRGAGVLRRDARSLHAGKNHRRRISTRGDRRARGHHGAVRSRQGRRRSLPDADRHAVRQSGRRGRRPGDARDSAAARRV